MQSLQNTIPPQELVTVEQNAQPHWERLVQKLGLVVARETGFFVETRTAMLLRNFGTFDLINRLTAQKEAECGNPQNEQARARIWRHILEGCKDGDSIADLTENNLATLNMWLPKELAYKSNIERFAQGSKFKSEPDIFDTLLRAAKEHLSRHDCLTDALRRALPELDEPSLKIRVRKLMQSLDKGKRLVTAWDLITLSEGAPDKTQIQLDEPNWKDTIGPGKTKKELRAERVARRVARRAVKKAAKEVLLAKKAAKRSKVAAKRAAIIAAVKDRASLQEKVMALGMRWNPKDPSWKSDRIFLKEMAKRVESAEKANLGV